MKFAVAIILCLFLIRVDALPHHFDPGRIFSFPKPERQDTNVVCDKIDKYSVEWFIANAPKTRKPKPSTCLFYTRGLSSKARNYAKKKAYPAMTTIWDVWPGGYYNKKMIKKNPLRCIMQQKKRDQRMYFENMSKAFASMCDIFATVMDSGITATNKTFHTVNKAGIWFNTEFPTLQKGYLNNKVYHIEAISPDGLTVFPYWTREGTAATSEEDDKGGTTSLLDKATLDSIFSDGELEKDVPDDVSYDQYVLADGKDNMSPEWWNEDGVLDDKDLEDWELNPI